MDLSGGSPPWADLPWELRADRVCRSCGKSSPWIIAAASLGPKWRNWRQKLEKLEPLGMPWAMPQGWEQALSAHHPTDVKNGWGRSKETLHLWNHLLRHFRTTVTQNLCCSRGIDLQTVLYDQTWRFVKSRDSWKTLMPQAHPLVSLILSARCIDWETSSSIPQQISKVCSIPLTVCAVFVHYLGVSENSVPLNPMVNDHYPY